MHHQLQCVMYCVCVVAVGGLTSPVRGPYTEPLCVSDKPPDSLQLINSSVNYEDEDQESVEKLITTGRRTKDRSDDDDEDYCPQTLICEPKYKRGNKISTVPELELRKLERGEVSLSVLLHSIVFNVSEPHSLCSFLFCRLLPEQSVPAPLGWDAGAAVVLSQQRPVLHLGTMGQKGSQLSHSMFFFPNKSIHWSKVVEYVKRNNKLLLM